VKATSVIVSMMVVAAVLLVPAIVGAAATAQSQVRIESRSTDGGPPVTRTWVNGQEVPPDATLEAVPGVSIGQVGGGRIVINGQEVPIGDPNNPAPRIMLKGLTTAPGDPNNPGPRIQINGKDIPVGALRSTVGNVVGGVKIDPADLEKLQPEIQAADKAIKDLHAKATVVLGDEAVARRFTMQQVMKMLPPPAPMARRATTAVAAPAVQAPDASVKPPEDPPPPAPPASPQE
jgi:hypothetical protein